MQRQCALFKSLANSFLIGSCFNDYRFMILPVTILGLLAYNGLRPTFSIVWFFFQSVITSNTLTPFEISLLLYSFFHIGSWFNHRPNPCHRATDT